MNPVEKLKNLITEKKIPSKKVSLSEGPSIWLNDVIYDTGTDIYAGYYTTLESAFKIFLKLPVIIRNFRPEERHPPEIITNLVLFEHEGSLFSVGKDFPTFGSVQAQLDNVIKLLNDEPVSVGFYDERGRVHYTQFILLK